MPANRVAAYAATLTAATGAIATVLGAVTTIAQAIVVAVALVCVAAVAVVFLQGSQKHELREHTDRAFRERKL